MKGKPVRKRSVTKPKMSSVDPSEPTKRIAVICIGNPLMRDDGAGLSVIGLLTKMPRNVAIIDGGTGGMGLLHLLGDLDATVIVDAVDFGGEPGEVRIFSLSQIVSTKKIPGRSLHEGDILKIIETAQWLDQCPSEMVICAIQPEEITQGMGLSIPVKKEIPALAKAVKEAVKKLL